MFCSSTTREIMMPPPLQEKNTKLSRPMAHRAPVTVIRGTVPECNYRDNSCLIIQWGEEPGSPLGGVWVAVRENSLNEGLSSPSITMGLSKLNPASLRSVNKDVSDNECTMGGSSKRPIIPASERSTRGWHGDMFTYFCFLSPLDTDICWKQEASAARLGSKRVGSEWQRRVRERRRLLISDRRESFLLHSSRHANMFRLDFKKVRPGASGCAGMTCKSVQRFTYLLCKCSFSCRKRGETKWKKKTASVNGKILWMVNTLYTVT